MILHIMTPEKFLPPFIDFVDKHFGRGEHKYVFISSEKYLFGLTPNHNVEFLYTDEDIFITLLGYMKVAKKIILHGLWRDKVDLLLVQNPTLLTKSYWVMWGGDFYFPERQTANRKLVIKDMANLISGVPGDIDYARQHYMASGHYYSCFMYPSNIFPSLPMRKKSETGLNILIGNSADAENNHFDIFKKLEIYKEENIKIFVPLSYGDKKYAEGVIEEGRLLFKDKFFPLTEMLSFPDYFKFLGEIDIAIFNHKRQQAMGNTVTLLGLGKQVYMRSDVAQWALLKSLGVEVFDIDKLNLSTDENYFNPNNVDKIKSHFSEYNLIKALSDIFNA